MQAIIRNIGILILTLGVILSPTGSVCFAECAVAKDACAITEGTSCYTDHSPECGGAAGCDGDCLCGPVCESKLAATGSAGSDVRVKDASIKVLLPSILTNIIIRPILVTQPTAEPLDWSPLPRDFPTSVLRTIVLIV